MALAADRNTPRRTGERFDYPVKANVHIYAGALVCLDANGLAVPGAVATTLKAVGRAHENVVGGAADGAVNVGVHPGIFRWNNSAAGDAIAQADVGNNCYVADDQTVAKTNGTNTRSVAGKIVDLDAQGVWVATGQVFAI